MDKEIESTKVFVLESTCEPQIKSLHHKDIVYAPIVGDLNLSTSTPVYNKEVMY